MSNDTPALIERVVRSLRQIIDKDIEAGRDFLHIVPRAELLPRAELHLLAQLTDAQYNQIADKLNDEPPDNRGAVSVTWRFGQFNLDYPRIPRQGKK